VVILQGESLLNDASGLVAYRVAIGVAAGQHFSVSGAVAQFVIAAAGGVVIGGLVGMAVIAIHKPLDERLIETVVTLLTPFAAYLACEALHLSQGLHRSPHCTAASIA